MRESRPVSGGVCSLSRTASEIATVEPNLKKRCLLSVWTEGRVSGSTKNSVQLMLSFPMTLPSPTPAAEAPTRGRGAGALFIPQRVLGVSLTLTVLSWTDWSGPSN